MKTNSDITLYNISTDRATKEKVYKRTFIQGVNWQAKQAITVTDKGINSADTVNIYIPINANTEGKKYLKPKAYSALSIDEKDSYFTFNNSDIIVKGLCDFELTGVKPNNAEYLNNLNDDVVNVISVINNDQVNTSMQHWKVGCK